MLRWIQSGVFQPRFSIHSASNDNTVTEPWMYRKSAGLIRDAILLRYRLAPYLYSAEYEAHETGAPIVHESAATDCREPQPHVLAKQV